MCVPLTLEGAHQLQDLAGCTALLCSIMPRRSSPAPCTSLPPPPCCSAHEWHHIITGALAGQRFGLELKYVQAQHMDEQ